MTFGGVMTSIRLMIFAASFLVALAAPAFAQTYVIQSLRIPMAVAGSQGLEGLIVRPAGRGPFPLAVISHGSPRDAADRPQMNPQQMLPQMMEFARRGWAAATVMRRGYGLSGGGWAESFGPCDSADYVRAGRAAAADLRAAFATLSRRADIDPQRMIAVGVSAGGFATVALTENPPPGLVAAISFAGGRGSESADEVCDEPALIDAFRTFGQSSRVPMLWVYAANDHFFGPQLAAQLQQAFVEAGGRVTFDHAAAFGSDGHMLFSAQGRPIWTPLVDAFLARQHLPHTRLLPAYASPSLAPPRQLSASGRKDFAAYLAAFPHKAFAVSDDGAYGWRTARRSADEASRAALDLCGAHAEACHVYAVDDGYAASR
jgi:dienelactone hydrolase